MLLFSSPPENGEVEKIFPGTYNSKDKQRGKTSINTSFFTPCPFMYANLYANFLEVRLIFIRKAAVHFTGQRLFIVRFKGEVGTPYWGLAVAIFFIRKCAAALLV